MYQQNNSPPRSFNANIGLNGPQPQISGQGPSISMQGPSTQFSGHGQTNISPNISGPGQFSAQGPSINTSGPSSSFQREGQFNSSIGPSSYNTQPSVSLSGPGSRDYTSGQQSSFNTQGPSVNIGGNNDFNSRNQFSGQGNLGQGPEMNVSLGGGQGGQYSMSGPDVNIGMNQGGYDMGVNIPQSSDGLRQYITKLPYTENIDGEEITYSIIPKKQASFVMTHDRFLLLKGIQILGYARELDPKARLPFGNLASIPSPKTIVQLTAIKQVKVEVDKLIVYHNDSQNTIWEFHCPTKRCAVDWNTKINEAMALLREFQSSGFGSPAEFYQFRSGNLGSRSSPPIQPPPMDNSPPRFNANISPPIDNSPSRFNTNISNPIKVETTNINYRVNHDDQVSRSVYDNSGPKANPIKFGQVNYNVNSPVKTQSYDVNYNVNQPQNVNVGLNMNANYQQGSQGGSTYGSSGRSFTMSSNSSLGRYPMGMPMGQQPHQVMDGRNNYRNV